MRQILPARRNRKRSSFHDLMQWRVGRLLLVSSLYDSFMLAEDRLAEGLVLGEFLGVELSIIPDIVRVSTGSEALAAVREPPGYDMVITSPIVGDLDAGELARRLRQSGVEVPVLMLAYHDRELKEFQDNFDSRGIDRAFLFQGDIQVFLAMVKYSEDLMNAQHDVEAMGVQAILVIEDDIRYYSYFLPVVYTAVLQNTSSLVPDGLNLAHKLLRARARPKILLASSYEEALRYFEMYQDNVLGIISDVEFPKDGAKCPDAGVQFAQAVKSRQPDVPVLLNSGKAENEELARAAGVSFLHKYSPTLLHDVHRFMLENFGFGDFVFRLPDQQEVARARDLKELEECVRTVPGESLVFHAERNHFSTWLKAHTEFDVAHRLRPRRMSEFGGPTELRGYLIQSIRGHRAERGRALVVDFDPEEFDVARGFMRIGGGSLGGKARGLAFASQLLKDFEIESRFDGVRIGVPASVVIGTDVFDEFLERNDLADMAITSNDEEEIESRFRHGRFPPAVRRDLRAMLERADYPLAVRSSSLLEDAKYQPFAGIYDTVMIPNDHADIEVRLAHLVQAIKRVYASTFSQRAKRYVRSTSYRLEGEKMAVIVQRIVGARHGGRFYPEIAGVALSQNFYPVDPVKPEDGLVAIALGMGAEVVGGEVCLRFSPKHPERLLQMSSVRDALRNSQREFYALEMGETGDTSKRIEVELAKFDLAAADADGTLQWTGSTYSPENDAIYDGVSRKGVRLVTFAPILKYRLFPLPEMLQELLAIGTYAAGGPVEIEFAVNLSTGAGQPKDFGFLQLRPVVHTYDPGAVDIDKVALADAVCWSRSVLGSGRLDGLRDVVVVNHDAFERGQSRAVAAQVASFNARLDREGVPYILIGVGRWGSKDPYLGIPVTWDQISAARVIVEAGFRDFDVTPSQGTHFFQNLVANNTGYFTTNPEAGEGAVDWAWLLSQEPLATGGLVRHLRFDRPLVVLMNGNRNEGAILKPGAMAPGGQSEGGGP